MSSDPVVSIIVPSYNCERFIAETLGSVRDQTFENWELIVVDDGSRDATVEIASQFDERIRVVQQKNAGVCAARNHGYRLSRGRFLCFLDHDDWWFPDKLARQLVCMKGMPEAGMCFTRETNWYPLQGVFPDPQSMRETPEQDGLDSDLTGWVYHRYLLECPSLTSASMIRREVLETVGPFDEALPYSEDWDLFLRITRQFQMAAMRWSSTLYRQHPGQGNRVPRPVDYRTRLMQTARARWGLTSQDGRSITDAAFRARLSQYMMEFGRMHLDSGSRWQGVRSLLDAWRHAPHKPAILAMALAGAGGWQPGD
jgi:glycosyltransferase involved in cell wall biosynthesis